VQAFRARNWTAVFRAAADVGHYTEDTTSPLHSTANFNGQLTGNNGIHGRHESEMVERHITLADLTTRRTNPPLEEGLRSVSDRVEFAFETLLQGYEIVMPILEADSAATILDGSFGDTYYAALFQFVGQQTIDQLNDGAQRLADLWHSAWVEAGRPVFDPAPVALAAPRLSSVVDGDLTEFEGESEFQTNTTDAGDNENELDQLFVGWSGGRLLLGVGGNLAPGNALILLLDSAEGGQSTLDIRAGPAPLQGLSGTVLDAGLTPDFALTVVRSAGGLSVHLTDLGAQSSALLGSSSAPVFPLQGGGEAGFDNSNTGGVRDRDGRTVMDAESVRTGLEISLPLESVGLQQPVGAVIDLLTLITGDSAPVSFSNQTLPGLPLGEFAPGTENGDTVLGDVGLGRFELQGGTGSPTEGVALR
jgi:hypothetical protein